MNVLPRTEFGNPILHQKAQKVSIAEIHSAKTQSLIHDMQFTLKNKKLGIGLAAPQVGQSKAIAVISIQPTVHRPDVEPFDLVLINPRITKTFGYRKQMWEGCLSAGQSGLFAKVPRFQKVTVEFYDQKGSHHVATFSDLKAQVVQHETDHLNGVLFMDRVNDTKSFMTMKEYKKQIVKKRSAVK